MKLTSVLLSVSLFGITACAPVPFQTSDQHIQESVRPAGAPPKIIQAAPLPEPPSSLKHPDVYTVVVNDVPAKQLLFAVARDADVEIDISGDISGYVTLNAIDVTFEQLLNRISRQVAIRYSVANGVVRVEPDAPYLEHYEVSYVNMDRTSESTIAIATEVSSTGSGGGNNSLGNVSSTSISNTSQHRFWSSLVTNIDSILRQHEPVLVHDVISPDSNSGESTLADSAVALSEATSTGANSVGGSDSNEADAGGDAETGTSVNPDIVVSRESGMISIYATQRQHVQVQEYLDLALSGAQRQVFIEATIVEVDLNDDYQAGVDWSRLVQAGENGFSFTQSLTGINLADPAVSTLQYTNSGNKYDVNATVKLLNQFGSAKVLSTPKILALNNQTALLKVVDNRVYFTIDVEAETTEFGITRTFESIIHTLPVGLVMSVTPQTSNDGMITLNVRPTISRILRFVPDPNPALAQANVESLIPEVSVREIETLLRVNDGDVAVIGGLMQDNRSDSTDGVPGLSKTKYFSDFFSYKDNKASKSELVIFLKPIVVDKPSLSGEFAQYKRFLDTSSLNTEANLVK